jgi:hypothetical protein
MEEPFGRCWQVFMASMVLIDFVQQTNGDSYEF